MRFFKGKLEPVISDWIGPVEGTAGSYTNHPSLSGGTPVDIPCRLQPVLAANFGKVVKVHKNPDQKKWKGYRADENHPKHGVYIEHPEYSSYGNHVIIEHYNDSMIPIGKTVYAHLSSIRHLEGMAVAQGEQIGVSGGLHCTRHKSWAVQVEKSGELVYDDGQIIWSPWTKMIYPLNFGPDGTGWNGSDIDLNKGEIFQRSGSYWRHPELIVDKVTGPHLHFEGFNFKDKKEYMQVYG